MEFYDHPTLGKILLVEHPNKPGRLAAYVSGVPIFETNKPEGWGVDPEVEDPPITEENEFKTQDEDTEDEE